MTSRHGAHGVQVVAGSNPACPTNSPSPTQLRIAGRLCNPHAVAFSHRGTLTPPRSVPIAVR